MKLFRQAKGQMSASPLWELSDSLFFTAVLFASFALLTGLSVHSSVGWKTTLVRVVSYAGAGLACMLQAFPVTPGFYFDFREVPLALAAGLLTAPWSMLIGAGLSLYRWLVLGTAGAGTATVQLAAVVGPSRGSVCSFIGYVRDETGGRPVSHLEYEAHQLGLLEVGDMVVVIAAAAPHRAEAFQAARMCAELMKQEVTIGKKEYGPDGAEWVGVPQRMQLD